MGLNARSIGLRIQQARVAKGMPQGELAKALGIDRGSVGRWETGRSIPRQVGIPAVAKILGQQADWLLEGSGNVDSASQSVEILRAERQTLRAIRDEVRKLSKSQVPMKTRTASRGLEESTSVVTATRANAKSARRGHRNEEIGVNEDRLSGHTLAAKSDRHVLVDILRSWDRATPEARLLAALLITGEWSYKLKLLNREIALGDDVLAAVGMKRRA